ncbi:type IV pilus biogenesis/stability protein PilW [Photobacterium halotolerans]|uniref:type IV pilus biogenesis/stability protein PilW n=1 Tax=Photobacterium halotolerans TaxID=265726 RepID=UPI001372924A|nr:type IV pilus biogenesis/stability protein PilW [Photobacterium halotolerans]NAW87639.1 type IV pilus biogenesis/stability protein PilW [Photobacterium halotolerans]NAX49159.1 type IV pilus biogenesis/stability protein PilW [Photobacterium halotolerans]
MVRWTLYPITSGFIAACLLVGCVTVDPTAKERSVDPIAVADARITLGLSYLEQGQRQRAQQNLQKALDVAPDHPRAQLAMAHYYQQVGENRSAEALYVRALQYSPKNGDVLNNYGVFLCNEARFDEADNAFMRAVLQPDYFQASATYENAALCSIKHGDATQAADYFRKALDHEPYRPLSMLQLARLELTGGDYRQAETRLDAFSLRYGETADSLVLKIQSSRQSGRLDRVEKYAELLRQQFPDSQQYQNYLANEY